MSALILADAKAHLNVTSTSQDDEIQALIFAAESRIAHDCGPLEPTETTVRVSGGDALVLPVVPAVSLTSVTPVGGSALALGDLYLDTRSGLVTYDQGGTFGAARYTVVYQSGRDTVDDDLLMGVKELVRFAWGSQRGGSALPGPPPSDGFVTNIPGAGDELPFNVQKWIRRHLQHGFA